MKIKKFKDINESVDTDLFSPDNDLGKDFVVEITFGGSKKVSFSDVKNTEYYQNYYQPNMTENDVDGLIFYSIEQIINEKGLGGYESELVDKNGKKVDIGLYLNSRKYNL